MNNNDRGIQRIQISLTEYPEFSDRLKFAMAVREYPNKRLAERLYVSHSTISGYCSGTRFPGYEVLKGLATELHVSADFLLGLDNHIDI